jgi:hypothetical protein
MHLPPPTRPISAPASRGEVRLLFTREGARCYEQAVAERRKVERKTALLIVLGVVGMIVVDVVIVQSTFANRSLFSLLAGAASLVITTGFCLQTFVRLWGATHERLPTQPDDEALIRVRSREHNGLVEREVQVGESWWNERERLAPSQTLAQSDRALVELLLARDVYAARDAA